MATTDSTREIVLTKGKVALVDECDFDWLSAYKWSALEQPQKTGYSRWYAVRGVRLGGSQHQFRMHRQIMGEPVGMLVDHRDGDGLNCRRLNLRAATHQQNMMNRTRRQAGKSSRFIGVYWNTERRLWQAQIGTQGTTTNLGRFDDETEAAMARDMAAKSLFGDFAVLNFRESIGQAYPEALAE